MFSGIKGEKWYGINWHKYSTRESQKCNQIPTTAKTPTHRQSTQDILYNNIQQNSRNMPMVRILIAIHQLVGCAVVVLLLSATHIFVTTGNTTDYSIYIYWREGYMNQTFKHFIAISCKCGYFFRDFYIG